MTNAKELSRPEWRCGECNAWARTKELADHCGKCATCNMPVKHNGAGWEDCTKCSRRKRTESAQARLAKAKDVSTEPANGMLYIDHELYPNHAPYDGRWCIDGGEALDYFDPGHHIDECEKVEEGEECPHQPPAEIWAYDSTPITSFALDADDIILHTPADGFSICMGTEYSPLTPKSAAEMLRIADRPIFVMHTRTQAFNAPDPSDADPIFP